MAERPQTLGEYRVGITFNPSNNPDVDHAKRMAAEFIDACEAVRGSGAYEKDAECQRLISLAQTHVEDAAMWIVKALTKAPYHG